MSRGLSRRQETAERQRGSERAKKRAEAFREANELVGFREYDSHAYAKQFGQTWVGVNRLDSLTIQKMATRAFALCKDIISTERASPASRAKARLIASKARPTPAASAGRLKYKGGLVGPDAPRPPQAG